ncbi:MAG: hypothetical protein HY022_08465 [Chloroflexi bacterium]|nr:hypothetical protein [Chloroflexota bacterium]
MATKNAQIPTTQPPLPASEKRPFESLREAIGLVSAGAGIFAALLYLAGRSFASGYFAAMNIAEYQLAFSLSEYGAVAWIPLFLYPIGMIVVSSLIGGILSAFGDWTVPLRARVANWLKQKVFTKFPSIHLPELGRKTKLWFWIADRAFFVFLFILLVNSTLLVVQQYGQWVGQNYVLQFSPEVELVSDTPMALENDVLTPEKASGYDYYVYNGLHLLTVNNGKYYLFKEIDAETCKPVKVYVVEERESMQVNLLPTVSLADQCTKTSPIQSITPAPTP